MTSLFQAGSPGCCCPTGWWAVGVISQKACLPLCETGREDTLVVVGKLGLGG